MVYVLDLYCGMGGLSLGFTLALEHVEILGFDTDRYAVDTYNYNLNRFNCKAKIQDVLYWKPKGKYDIIIGGVPCQPYSLANTRKRGKEHPLYPTLPRFFDIVLELKPKVFLMENVKGLVTKRHKPLLIEQLKRVEPYYNIIYRVLNSAYYGVPQRRERLFVLGFRRDLDIQPSFPVPTHAEEEKVTLFGKLYRWVTVREAIGDLLLIPPTNYPKKLIQTNPKYGKVIDMNKASRVVKVDGRGGDFTFDTMLIPLITEHEGTNVRIDISNPKGFGDASKVPNKLDLPAKTVLKGGGSGGAIPPLVEIPTEHIMTKAGGWVNPKSDWGSRVIPEDKPSYTITEKHRSGQLIRLPSEHEVGVYSMKFSSKSLSKHKPQELDKPSSTIRASFHKIPPDATIKVRSKYRRLTVRECLRLQSFPDWWKFPSNTSISRKYKLVGEAVPPIMAYRLAVHIGKLLDYDIREPPREEEWMLPYFKRAFQDYLE